MEHLATYSSEIVPRMFGLPAGAYGAEAWETEMAIVREEGNSRRADVRGYDAARLGPEGVGAEVRVEKVAALRRAIAEGSYVVEAEEVAEKLVERMLR